MDSIRVRMFVKGRYTGDVNISFNTLKLTPFQVVEIEKDI